MNRSLALAAVLVLASVPSSAHVARMASVTKGGGGGEAAAGAKTAVFNITALAHRLAGALPMSDPKGLVPGYVKASLVDIARVTPAVAAVRIHRLVGVTGPDGPGRVVIDAADSAIKLVRAHIAQPELFDDEEHKAALADAVGADNAAALEAQAKRLNASEDAQAILRATRASVAVANVQRVSGMVQSLAASVAEAGAGTTALFDVSAFAPQAIAVPATTDAEFRAALERRYGSKDESER